MYPFTKWIRSVLYLPLPGRKKLWFLTAAEALAMTEARVSAGNLAMVLDQGGKIVEAQTPGPASTTWAQRVTDMVYGTATTVAGTELRYIDMVGSTSPATGIGATNRMLLPYPGEVRALHWHPSSDPDSTIVGTHLDINTTPTETETLDPPAGAKTTFPFAATPFTAGQVLSISIDATNTYGFSRWALELEYLIPLGAS